MSNPAATATTSDERLLAAVSHGSIILLGWGLIVPLLVWISQREKSAYVAFHALQALVYQLLQMLYWFVMLVAILCAMLMLMPLAIAGVSASPDPDAPAIALMLAVQFVPFLCMACGFVLYLVPGIAGAVAVLLNRDFRYPVLGRRLESYLLAAPPDTEVPQ